MDTMIFKQENNSWLKIASDEDGGDEIGTYSEVGHVKKDWKCHLCMYNDYNSGINIFKLISPSKQRFKIVCADCAECEDMIGFLFGIPTHKFLVNYNKENGSTHN